MPTTSPSAFSGCRSREKCLPPPRLGLLNLPPRPRAVDMASMEKGFVYFRKVQGSGTEDLFAGGLVSGRESVEDSCCESVGCCSCPGGVVRFNTLLPPKNQQRVPGTCPHRTVPTHSLTKDDSSPSQVSLQCVTSHNKCSPATSAAPPPRSQPFPHALGRIAPLAAATDHPAD